MTKMWTILDIAALVLIFLVTLFAKTAMTITNLCLILTVIFLVKAVVQDLWFGKIKGNNSVPLTVFNLIIDFIRVMVFFATVSDCAVNLKISYGLGHIGNMLSYVAILIIGGVLFLAGEIISLQHGMEEELIIKGKKVGRIMDIAACVLLILVCALWWM